MAVPLLTYLQEQITPGVIDLLSAELNELPEHTHKAVNGSLPVLLSALTRRVQASGGAAAVIDKLHEGDYGHTPLDVSQVLAEHRQTVETAIAGRNFLDEILGADLTPTTELISTYSGVKSASVLTLMGLMGSVLMGVLGRQQQENGLTTHSLTTLLMGQATGFRKAVPNGLAGVVSLLGLDALQTPAGLHNAQGTDNLSGTVVSPNIPKSTEDDRLRENKRWLRWAMVAIAVLVAALIIQKCSQNQNSSDGISTDSTARVESNQAEDTSAATKQSIREAHGQVRDSTASGALGIRDSVQVKPQ